MDTITDVRVYQNGNVWYVEFKRNGVLETTEPFGEEETATNHANFLSNTL
jgi:Flp pilus assembly CpaF family ATPase